MRAGAAPGLTNLLVARAAAMMHTVDEVHIRLYESTESDDPVSQWSAEVSFDEAVSRPRIVRGGKFRFGKPFGNRRNFAFPRPSEKQRSCWRRKMKSARCPIFFLSRKWT